MSMNVGGGSALCSEINITPLVDVVLVLLIIFMVATPMLQMGYDVRVPPKAEDAGDPTAKADPTEQIIVQLDSEGRVFINKDEVPEKDFAFRFRTVIQGRESKIIFFAASGALGYEKVVQFLDTIRQAGATNIGIVFEEMSGGELAAPAAPSA